MKTTLFRNFLSNTLMLFLIVSLSFAQIPKLINYQGVLTDAGGTVVPDGNNSLTFKLYDVATGGTPLWTESYASVAVTKGIFNVNLGSVNTLNLPFDNPYWLGITIGNGSELTPRMQLTGSGYSFRSSNTENITGIAAGGDLSGTYPNPGINDAAITSSKLASGIVVTSLNGLTDAVSLEAGSNVSITPAGNTITISATPGGGGGDITGVTAGTGLSGGGMSGDVTLNVAVPLLLGTGSATPIIGVTNSGSGAGVTGFSNGGNGLDGNSTNGDGVYGHSESGDGVGGNSVSGHGLYGTSTSGEGVRGFTASGDNGVFGQTDKANGNGVYGNCAGGNGVYGNSTSGDGVSGHSVSGNGLAGFSTSGEAVYGNSADGNGVYGTSGGSGSGVYGNSVSGNGVYGNSSTGNGFYGHSNTGDGVGGNSTSGHGLYGTSTSGEGVRGYTATGYNGVFGQSDRSDGNGVYGTSIGGTSSAGVYGESINGDGVAGFSPNGTGVYGLTTSGYAVFGYCPSGNAGGFTGNVAIVGNFSVSGTKNFRIDHPLDPANKYLVHSCIESNEVLNIYSGNITLDSKGEAWVELPAYFEALNKDFRYQLTCIGGFAQVYVAQKISGNRYRIAGGNPGLEVSWQVTGVRNDPYLKAHPYQAEVEKIGAEQGKYLTPKEYGVSETLGINYEMTHKMDEKIKANALKMQSEKINNNPK